MIEAYIIHLLILIGIYSILAVSLNLALGNTGLMNMGHIAFFGIGAYTSVILTKDAGLPFILAFLIAGLFTSVWGFVLVYATKKLRGDYLALATLGFSFVIYSLMLNWTALTRGPLGIPGISKPCFFGICIADNTGYLIFVVIVAIISIGFMYFLAKSNFGRLLSATRDDEVGLRALGKNTFKLKSKVMIISAFFAGIAGSLFAHYISYIDPSSFMLTEVILIFTIVIVGGIASIWGSVVSAAIIMIVPELLRFLNIPSSILGPARQIIYALILLIIILWRPKGLFGRVDLE